MIELKPCPFCGSTEERYAFSFKNDRKKVNGVYYKLCTIKCGGCTATITQAGLTKERAEENAIRQWNRRAES